MAQRRVPRAAQDSRHQYGDAADVFVDNDRNGRLDDLNRDGRVDTRDVTVMLARSNRVLSVPSGQPLLAALEAQGMKPKYGCRMGICNTCACGKTAGTTQDLNSGDLCAEPVSALRLCVSRACTDLTLDL